MSDEQRDEAALPPNPGPPAEDGQSPPQNSLSRRDFIQEVGRLAAGGALAHFALFGQDARADEVAEQAADLGDQQAAEPEAVEVCTAPHPDQIAIVSDRCPGGMSANDVCNSTDPDRCPGEEAADECPGGARPEDRCESGIPSADICDDSPGSDSDQCSSGMPADDTCESTAGPPNDRCWTGQVPQDSCPPDGGLDVDACPGGGPENDNCTESGAGDACPQGTFGLEDDCSATQPDVCTGLSQPTEDDTCYTGQSGGPGTNGGDDLCDGLLDSDVCTTGTSTDDLCGTIGETDVCPGGGASEDFCGSYEGGAYSPDICVASVAGSDLCAPVLAGDPDECPGGGAGQDECVWYSPDPDEVVAGIPGIAV